MDKLKMAADWERTINRFEHIQIEVEAIHKYLVENGGPGFTKENAPIIAALLTIATEVCGVGVTIAENS